MGASITHDPGHQSLNQLRTSYSQSEDLDDSRTKTPFMIYCRVSLRLADPLEQQGPQRESRPHWADSGLLLPVPELALQDRGQELHQVPQHHLLLYSPHPLPPLDSFHYEETQMCIQYYKVYLVFEYMPHTLLDEIRKRKQN